MAGGMNHIPAGRLLLATMLRLRLLLLLVDTARLAESTGVMVIFYDERNRVITLAF